MKFKCILSRVTTTRRDDSNCFELQKDTTRRRDATTRRDDCAQLHDETTRLDDGTERHDETTVPSFHDATRRDEL